jgi:hypothetical protein
MTATIPTLDLRIVEGVIGWTADIERAHCAIVELAAARAAMSPAARALVDRQVIKMLAHANETKPQHTDVGAAK